MLAQLDVVTPGSGAASHTKTGANSVSVCLVHSRCTPGMTDLSLGTTRAG